MSIFMPAMIVFPMKAVPASGTPDFLPLDQQGVNFIGFAIGKIHTCE
jgi:hypothetical protein